MASLVYHAGALGDFITALPAVGVWRRLHQGERTVLLGAPGFAELALPPFDETWDARGAPLAALFAAEPGPMPGLAERFRQFDSALLFSPSASPLAHNLGSLGVREILRQDPFPSGRIPVVDYHLSLFPAAVIREEDKFPAIRASARRPAERADATVALHHGSGSPAKNWPVERFVELARSLKGDGETVAWIIGPVEEPETVPGIAEGGLPSGARALAWRGLGLPDLAAAIAGCKLYVGNDSGVTHLAAACGCPTVALFGASDPAVWAPRGPAVSVVLSRHSGMNGMRVRDVLRICRRMLGRQVSSTHTGMPEASGV